ncbi:hypothetical protein V6N11_037265 [Hibiscus sabdariffa]|uniref:Uncharacterized protein n=1 Tax=Hibiscus sabdariffa TaxID=183260 RepID=A0ABR2P132_9ROSI
MRDNPSLPLGPSPYENFGGRPPEVLPSIDGVPTRERPSSSMLLEEQRSAKKGKSGGADDVWVDSSMMDADNEGGEISNEQIEPKEQSEGVGDGQHNPSEKQPASYAAAVSEGLRMPNQEIVDGFAGDSVEILAEDIIESCVVGKKSKEILQNPAVSGTDSNVDTSAVVSEANLYGPWMVVDRRCRSGQHSLVNRNVRYGGEGSRFSVLQEVEDVRMVGSGKDDIPSDKVTVSAQQQATHNRRRRAAVRVIEGEGQVQPTTLLKPQRLKGVVSKGSLDTMHRGVKVGKSMTSRMLSQMSPAKFARQLSEQLDAGDLPDGFEEGVDHTVVLTHSSDDDVAFLAEF